jgi:para-aminobenzoate synthetase/4-amino-4-deoxychorismate lyase
MRSASAVSSTPSKTAIANVVVRIGDTLYTPPISCGLLAGTYRNRMLRDGRISERKIHVDELAEADEIVLINLVRGEYPAEIVKSSLPRQRKDDRMRTLR